MIGLNTLINDAGVDLAKTRLVRHQNTRGRVTPYQLWRADDGRLELYQSIQKRAVFKDARTLAVFVVTPLDETLFVGLYAVEGVGKAPRGLEDPLSGREVSGLNFYDLTPMPELANYRGRLIIDWGRGYRSWVQLAENKDKPILEIRRGVSDPPFPGFLDFRSRLSELATVPMSWRTALSAVSGIYLLVSPDNGEQYVGLAHGADGFWGRWESYAASGHGGNKRMIDIPAADYWVTVLEVANSSSDIEKLAEMETRWKRKLLSREFGLNAN